MKDQNAGIWIDREHATAVLVSADSSEFDTFQAGVSKTFPQTKESRTEHEHSRNDFVAEDRLERKQESRCTIPFFDTLRGPRHYLFSDPEKRRRSFKNILRPPAIGNMSLKSNRPTK